MKTIIVCKKIVLLPLLIAATCFTCLASETGFKEARTLQRNGEYEAAIKAYKEYLTTPTKQSELKEKELFYYTEALVQLMNTYQSLGEPEACVVTLKEIFKSSPVLQHECLRD